MRRIALLVLSLAAAVGLAEGTAGGAGAPFALGVAAGEVTSSSAILWTRAPAGGRVELRGACEITKGRTDLVAWGRATPATDLTVSVTVRRLPPAAACTYRFAQGSARSPLGRFETAPLPTADVPVRFAYSGDADATPGKDGKPGFNGFETYARMAAERNDFNVNMGDTIYSDSEVAGSPPALHRPREVGQVQARPRAPPLRTLRASTGLYSHWDDHEFINDFSRAENGEAIYAAGVKAFTRLRTGRRRRGELGSTGRSAGARTSSSSSSTSARSAPPRSTAACGGDLAPTAPQAVREAFADPRARPRATPSRRRAWRRSTTRRARCSARAARRVHEGDQGVDGDVEDRSSTRCRSAALRAAVRPLGGLRGRARRGCCAILQANVQNVVFLTTDTHANLSDEIARQDARRASRTSSGIWEVITGPVATNTFAKEIDTALGAAGHRRLRSTSLFLKPALPSGIGLRCTATDTYGYSQVKATRTTLTVTPKAATGGPVREKTGAVCAPLVLQAR